MVKRVGEDQSQDKSALDLDKERRAQQEIESETDQENFTRPSVIDQLEELQKSTDALNRIRSGDYSNIDAYAGTHTDSHHSDRHKGKDNEHDNHSDASRDQHTDHKTGGREPDHDNHADVAHDNHADHSDAGGNGDDKMNPKI